MRKFVFYVLLIGLAVAFVDWTEPELLADTMSSASSASTAIVTWFDD